MSQSRILLTQDFDASPKALWDAITDHEGMSRWMDAQVSLLARREGGGVGSVRRIRARGIVIDEEVVYADPPLHGSNGRLVYRIVRGVPVQFHRGEMIVEPRSGGARSRLTWDIVVASNLPGVANIAGLALKPVLTAGLRKLAKQLQTSSRAAASALS